MDLFEDRVVPAFQTLSHALQQLGQAAGREVQSADRFEQLAGSPHGQTGAVAQKRGQGLGAGPQVRARRSAGGGGLQGMRAANLAAGGALANVGFRRIVTGGSSSINCTHSLT